MTIKPITLKNHTIMADAVRNAVMTYRYKDGKEYEVEIREIKSTRSIEISTRFWGHLTFLWKNLVHAGYEVTQEQVKHKVLLRACAIPDDELTEGLKAWPYYYSKLRLPESGEVHKVLIPSMSTSDKTNGQMMTACFAMELVASDYSIILPEKGEGNG
jgi:hypothetical protein